MSKFRRLVTNNRNPFLLVVFALSYGIFYFHPSTPIFNYHYNLRSSSRSLLSRPAQSFIPYTSLTNETRPYFLLDRQLTQDEVWEDESWKPLTSWVYAGTNKRFDPVGWDGEEEEIEKRKMGARSNGEAKWGERGEGICLTYEGRYGLYDPLSPSYVPSLVPPIPPTLGARTALIIRLSTSSNPRPLSEDMILHLRATVVEVQAGVGIDVWVVVNHEGTKEDGQAWLSHLPKDLQPRTLMFSTKNTVAPYTSKGSTPFPYSNTPSHPLPEEGEEENGGGVNLLEEGRNRGMYWNNHLSASWFMDLETSKGYANLWWFEGDVRLVGSWPSFFNSLNTSLPTTTPSPITDVEIRSDLSPPSKERFSPDFLTLSIVVHNHQDWKGGDCSRFLREDALTATYLPVWGMSRKLHEAMKTYYRRGWTCYTEWFPISVAVANNLTIAPIQPLRFFRDFPDSGYAIGDHEGANSALTTYFVDLGGKSTEFYGEWFDSEKKIQADVQIVEGQGLGEQRKAVKKGLCRRGPAVVHPWKK